jgi:transposase
VQTLRQVWLQNYYGAGVVRGGPRLREARDQPPKTLVLQSPYDPEARYSKKRETTWTGYKVQCDSFPRNRPAMVGG